MEGETWGAERTEGHRGAERSTGTERSAGTERSRERSPASGGALSGRIPWFEDPQGGVHLDGRWTPLAVGDPERLTRDNVRLNGTRPDGWTASVQWKREEDIPVGLHSRAMEALAGS